MPQVIITEETLRALERERAELQRKQIEISERLTIVMRKIEAIPLFLGNGNQAAGRTHEVSTGDIEVSADHPEIKIDNPKTNNPMIAIYRILEKAKHPLSPAEIKSALQADRFPMERFGPTMSYFYTVLMRMKRARHIENKRGKYFIAPKTD